MDADFDKYNIRNGEPRKDHLVLWRRRAVLLTSLAYLSREADKALAVVALIGQKQVAKIELDLRRNRLRQEQLRFVSQQLVLL
jgi:hypothetical protein